MLGFGTGASIFAGVTGVVGFGCSTGGVATAGFFSCCIGPFMVRAGPGVGGGIIGSDGCGFWGVCGPWLKLLFVPLRFWF